MNCSSKVLGYTLCCTICSVDYFFLLAFVAVLQNPSLDCGRNIVLPPVMWRPPRSLSSIGFEVIHFKFYRRWKNRLPKISSSFIWMGLFALYIVVVRIFTVLFFDKGVWLTVSGKVWLIFIKLGSGDPMAIVILRKRWAERILIVEGLVVVLCFSLFAHLPLCRFSSPDCIWC